MKCSIASLTDALAWPQITTLSVCVSVSLCVWLCLSVCLSIPMSLSVRILEVCNNFTFMSQTTCHQEVMAT